MRCEIDKDIADVLLRFTRRNPLKNLRFTCRQVGVIQRFGQSRRRCMTLSCLHGMPTARSPITCLLQLFATLPCEQSRVTLRNPHVTVGAANRNGQPRDWACQNHVHPGKRVELWGCVPTGSNLPGQCCRLGSYGASGRNGDQPVASGNGSFHSSGYVRIPLQQSPFTGFMPGVRRHSP